MLTRNLQAWCLKFTGASQLTIAQGDIAFTMVGTPPNPDGSAELSHVLDMARQIVQHMQAFKLAVKKSVVPVETVDHVKGVNDKQPRNRGDRLQWAVVLNPAFLNEGAAVEDVMRADRIVIGLADTASGQLANESMTQRYASCNRHHKRTLWMNILCVERNKYAANAMHAAGISLINERAHLADQVGVRSWVEQIVLAESPEDALCNANVLIVLTEQKCFCSPDFLQMAAWMRTPQILDGRNLYDPRALLALDMPYQGIGRNNENPFVSPNALVVAA
jgi:UDP-glucose 6-dehydrogenase